MKNKNSVKEKLLIPMIFTISVPITLLILSNIWHFHTDYILGISTLPLITVLGILVIYNAFSFFLVKSMEGQEKNISSLKLVGITVLI